MDEHPSRLAKGRTSEDGAVAVVVAILLTALLGISAFAVDFGLAYTEKRQLQTAADAAAVAAASTYLDEDGDCTTLTDTSTAAGAALAVTAQAEAEEIMLENDSDASSVPADFSVGCTDTGGVQVTWSTTGISDVGLGGVLGAGDITSTRSATAAVEVPATVGSGLRPYFMCSLDLPATGGDFPTEVMIIGGVTNGMAYDPACPEPSGNWWTINCPEDIGNNGEPALRDAIQYGCDYPVTIVDDPMPPPPSDVGLEAACPPVDPPSPTIPEDCLEANPGNITNQQTMRWDLLIASGETVILPVFCGTTHCNPDAALIFQGGNNAEYPIFAFAAMRVCGYHFGNRVQPVISADVCGNNPGGVTTAPGGSQSHYMAVSFQRVQLSGALDPSGCAIGDPDCDGGLRQVFLTS